MLLSDFFKNAPEMDIKQLSIDSRVPMRDCIFFCLSGIKDDGHNFVEEAIKNGATVIVYENEINTNQNAVFIKVSNVAACLNEVASKFYNYPADKLEVYLTGGSEDVSSITFILYKLLNNFLSTASIGSHGIYYSDNHLISSFPTLNILDNQKYLNEFVKNNVKACCLEADVLAISYKKLDSIKPDVFIYNFTNTTSSQYEELENDYFDIMCSYLYTLDDATAIVLNRDDLSYNELIKACGTNVYSFGMNPDSDFFICDIEIKPNYSCFSIKVNNERYFFTTRLIGLKNIYNLTACLSALYIKGYNLEEISALVPNIKPLHGIMEYIDIGQQYNIVIDEANNLNSIKSAYEYAKRITPENKKIIALWGIDSSDDKNSYIELAKLSEQYIDQIVLTERNTYKGSLSDNFDIADKTFKNLNPLIIEDRQSAIELSIDLLDSQDTLLLLGKGKQNYMIRNIGKEHYLGDNEIAIRKVKENLI